VYAAAGTYKITLVTKSLLGCVSLPAEQTVLVSPIPKVAFTPPASVCFPGNPAQFTNTSTVGDNSGLSYVWDFGDGSPTSTAVNGSRIYSAVGTYPVKLTATSGKGCVDSVRQSFSAFFGKPVAAFLVDARNICQGVDTRFSDGSTDAGSTITGWAWTFGDGTVSATRNPLKRFSLPGTYVVSLTATNAGGCVSDPVRDTVRVFLQPVVDAGPSFVVQQGSKVTFQPKVNDTTLRLLWSPAPDISSANVLRATVTANQDQIYRLTAVGQNNCTASDSLTVRILKPVKVPNAFSPNGDGVHDTWFIEHMADYPGSSILVFNRYGQQVFMSKGYTTPWDGKVNGKDLPVGVYYYIIELRNGFSPLNGSITIIR
jgi:gliding motility-associated-like protein